MCDMIMLFLSGRVLYTPRGYKTVKKTRETGGMSGDNSEKASESGIKMRRRGKTHLKPTQTGSLSKKQTP